MSSEIPTRSATGLSDFSWQWLLAIGYFLVVASWSLGIAFNGAPDESTHFYLLEVLRGAHALPLATEPHEVFVGTISGHTWQKDEFWYHGLPFPHILGALVTTYVSSWIVSPDFLYLGARSFDWILGGVFICALFRISRLVGLSPVLSALIAGIIALIPQVTFVFSYFNSDAYGLTSIALLISTLMSFIQSPTRKRALYFGLAVGLMLMAKLYFIPALVFAFVTLLSTRMFRNKRLFEHLPTMIVAAAVLAAPMLILVYHKYGEISGISGQIEFVNLHRLNPAAGFGTCYFRCGHDFLNTANLWPWLGLTYKSYFSVTGWMNLFIPTAYYQLAAFALIGSICVAIAQVKPLSVREPKREIVLDYILPLVMIVGLFPSMTLFSLIASQNSLPQPQGRYLFVTIPFMALLLSLIAKRLVERMAK